MKDTSRHLREAWLSLRARLVDEAGQDCLPLEEARRLRFIEHACRGLRAFEAILDSAAPYFRAPG